jgi:hypothetical protein
MVKHISGIQQISMHLKIPMPREYKDIILEQWEYGIEASRIPGNYMVEREISNAWTRLSLKVQTQDKH